MAISEIVSLKSGNFGTFFPQKNVPHMLSVFFSSLISICFSISSSQIDAAVVGGVAGVSLESVKIFRGIGGTMGTE